jgi:hypothetical protein
MNLYRLRYIAFALILLSASCGKSGNEKNLENRERKVKSKEQQLLMLQQQLNLKEQELIKREQQIDSLKAGSDSIGTYNQKLIGNWTVTMQCIETTCEGSAIGDTKTEQWNISYQNNKVIAKSSVNNRSIRTYTGLFKENSLKLSAALTPGTDTYMDVTLSPHPTTDRLMEGQRVINHRGKCKIVFAIKAEKI